MLMACSGRQFGLCRRFTYRTIIPPTPFRCTTGQEILHLRMYFCSIILARTQHSGMHFGWPARMTACTSWVSHLISCYSPSSVSSPSPSSSSLSSSLLPPSTAFPFPFCVDPPPPTLPCTNLPTRPECTKALLSDSTMPIRCSCLASCFQVTLSCCLHNLMSICHNSFTSQATSMLSCFPLAPDSALSIHIVTRRSIMRVITSLLAAMTGGTRIAAFRLIARKPCEDNHQTTIKDIEEN